MVAVVIGVVIVIEVVIVVMVVIVIMVVVAGRSTPSYDYRHCGTAAL